LISGAEKRLLKEVFSLFEGKVSRVAWRKFPLLVQLEIRTGLALVEVA
jgi:hypothetical protein